MKTKEYQEEIEKALNDNKYLEELLRNISPERKKHTDRDKSRTILITISEKYPERLYDKWYIFTEYLRSNNAFSKSPSLYIIANLIVIDSEGKFNKYIDEYLDLLNNKSVMIASHLALNCGKIVKMKPEFEPQITTKLLKIDSTSHSTEHKELIKSYIIEAFYSYFHQSPLKREIINFIREQINSDSNKTRKIAKKILMELDN